MKLSKKSKLSLTPGVHRELAATHAGLRLVRRFQNALAVNRCLPRGSKILVAVSGGPDSMALLHLLGRLKKKHAFRLHVAHVNYGLRGRDSERDETLVHVIAQTLGLPISVLSSRIKPKRNTEARLREMRYAYFEKVRKRLGFSVIVTAHTMDDLAETFLMNLIRGAGPTGLSPFRHPLSRHIVRPLLDFRKKELVEFLEAEHLKYRLDRSNHSRRFIRNRIRHELLPLLETFNPSIVATLAATTRRLSRKTFSTRRGLTRLIQGGL